MKKYILISFILIAAIAPFFIFKDEYYLLISLLPQRIEKKQINSDNNIDLSICRKNLLNYLKLRKDNLALIEIQKILSVESDDLTALWGRAEVLRRNYKLKESEELLNQILFESQGHPSSLISLSYIRYYDNKLGEALKLLKQVLNQPNLDRQNLALAYMLIGSINAKKATLGGFLSKITYGMRIKNYFEKAKQIAPDLSEVHLGLGSFYLLAPTIAGGSLDKAVEELEWAVGLTPDFATANARLAQAYKKKGNLEKYNFYLRRAKELDPQNEVITQISTDERTQD